MTQRPDSNYLWDRSGPVDPDVARLETLLAPLRHAGSSPAPPAARPAARRTWLLALAAAVLLVAVVAWFARPRGQTNLAGWEIAGQSGPLTIASTSAGASIATGSGATLNLVRGPAHLWLGADTSLSLAPAPPEAIAGILSRGTLFVDLSGDQPLRLAFPLGEFTVPPNTSASIHLQDSAGMPGGIELKRGMVQLTLKGRVVRVLPGRRIDLRADVVSTPSPDATPLADALRRADTLLDQGSFGPDLDAAIAQVAATTSRDTADAGWNLAWRLDPAGRAGILEDLRQDLGLAALPAGAAQLDPAAMDALWRAITAP